MADAGLRDRLVRELGLAVSGVRMSPDCLKAYVQWESCTGQAHALQRELNQRVGQLRSKLGRALGARKTPWLEFRQAAPTGEQAHLERIFEQLDRERREQDEEARWARERGQVAQEGDASAAAGGQGQQRPPPAGQ